MGPGQKKKPKRRPGGQPGNTNARKHGFYSYSLTPDELKQFKFLTEVRKIDPEVVVFHIKYRQLFENGGLTTQTIDAASGNTSPITTAPNSDSLNRIRVL